jgi:hypothetical protein
MQWPLCLPALWATAWALLKWKPKCILSSWTDDGTKDSSLHGDAISPTLSPPLYPRMMSKKWSETFSLVWNEITMLFAWSNCQTDTRLGPKLSLSCTSSGKVRASTKGTIDSGSKGKWDVSYLTTLFRGLKLPVQFWISPVWWCTRE